jgi:exodeoxyribonuclease X
MIIRCIDFETTGIPTETDRHAIVEIGWCDLDIDDDNGGAFVSGFEAVLCNPERPIPHEAMAIHHITDQMVSGASGSLEDLGSSDYFAAHNADYERSFFPTETPFICTYKVALRVWPDVTSHGLQFLRYHLGLPTREELAMPHRAGPDAYLCALLLQKIIQTEPSLSFEQMVRWSNGPALLPRCPLTKHKGQKWEDVPTDYLEFIVYKAKDISRDVLANAKLHLKQRQAQ